MRAETFIEKSDRYIIKRSGDIRDWRVRAVCTPHCNNGWMREKVEDPARHVMIPLITGAHFRTGEPIRISPQDQKIIARWAVLKAMVAEFDTVGWPTTHHAQRKQFMRTLTPPAGWAGWAVWIGHYVRGRWQPLWASTPFLYQSDKQAARRPDIRATHYNSHISTQVVGQLFIHVVRSPARRFIQGWRFSPPEKGTLFRIWPASGVSISWPGKTLLDRDADYVASAMAMFLLDRGVAFFGKQLAQGNAPPGTAEALETAKRLFPGRA